jgi:hypothetical protein
LVVVVEQGARARGCVKKIQNFERKNHKSGTLSRRKSLFRSHLSSFTFFLPLVMVTPSELASVVRLAVQPQVRFEQV